MNSLKANALHGIGFAVLATACFATLDTTTSPNRAVIGVVNASAGYSLAGAYPRI